MGQYDYPCLIDDVANYLPPGQSITDATTPSLDNVNTYITNVCDVLNAILEDRGYALPLDPSLTAALSFLNTACVFGAMAAWAAVKYPSDVGPGGSKGLAERYEKQFEAMKLSLETRSLGLPDVARNSPISGFEHTSRPFVRRGSVY